MRHANQRQHDAMMRGAPPLPLLAAEQSRAAVEFASALWSWPWLQEDAPRGDGHPVLVLPGLLYGDSHTALLRAHLARCGFAVSGWGSGINTGHWEALDTVVLPALERLHAEHGRRVSLVGASMGGLFARAAAAAQPLRVRRVITLASAAQPPSRANHVWPLYQAMTGQPAETMVVPPPPVPSTSIFSRSDGLSDWVPNLQPEGRLADNVEVESSHLGMLWHPGVLRLVAQRLARPEGH
jgi:pimeloyl-ACP methyl ester carboxylesterase